MFRNHEKGSLTVKRILRGLLVWIAAACLLLFLSAAIICAGDLKASGFSYFSAAAGFISAVCAAYSGYTSGDKPIRSGFLFGLILCVLLLTTGFLIAGERISASGILSVAGTTIIGSLLGTILAAKHKKLQNRRKGIARKAKLKFT